MTEYPKIQNQLELIQLARDKIKEIQHNCVHEGLLGKYGSNTGNYCRQDDSYWVDFMCPNCGKHWTEDQEDVGLLTSKEGFGFSKVEVFHAP